MKEASSMNNPSSVSVSALGDISFMGRNSDNPSTDVFSAVSHIFQESDIVIANLESPLTQFGEPVSGKCVLRGSSKWARVMREAGIHLVSLANNHIMDYGPQGLLSSIQALKDVGIQPVGAGENQNIALSTNYVLLNGQRCAFLARSSVIVSSPSYASGTRPGVAFFDVNETKAAIKECKRHANTVVLLLHWGVEHYLYPAPSQRKLARELIEAGADLILGHHPHVLQGIEKIGDGLVCYSLGNFLFDDIYWSFIDEDGHNQERVVKLTEDNRKGGILKVGLSEADVQYYEFLPTLIQFNGTLRIENTLARERQFRSLCSRLHWPGYNLFWKGYSLRQEWFLRFRPALRGKLTWNKLKKLRFKHFKVLLKALHRSAKITVERSTNPYE